MTRWDGADQGNHLAKVRVAGSNPVVRSKEVLVRRDAFQGVRPARVLCRRS